VGGQRRWRCITTITDWCGDSCCCSSPLGRAVQPSAGHTCGSRATPGVSCRVSCAFSSSPVAESAMFGRFSTAAAASGRWRRRLLSGWQQWHRTLGDDNANIWDGHRRRCESRLSTASAWLMLPGEVYYYAANSSVICVGQRPKRQQQASEPRRHYILAVYLIVVPSSVARVYSFRHWAESEKLNVSRDTLCRFKVYRQYFLFNQCWLNKGIFQHRALRLENGSVVAACKVRPFYRLDDIPDATTPPSRLWTH